MIFLPGNSLRQTTNAMIRPSSVVVTAVAFETEDSRRPFVRERGSVCSGGEAERSWRGVDDEDEVAVEQRRGCSFVSWRWARSNSCFEVEHSES
jgi:hypothetical protein